MSQTILLGLTFIAFGVTSIITFSPDDTAGRVAVVIMCVIFILVGLLYGWMGIKAGIRKKSYTDE